MGFFENIRRPIDLMRVSGTPVRADMRWFFVLVLITVVTAASIHRGSDDWLTSILLGLATTLVFFASIFVHELAHAVAARSEGLGVVEIVLHPFGGLTRFVREPETPRAEFRIAIAGPVASFILAIAFALLMTAANWAELDILRDLLFLLALANFLLAVFNMFPGYPLDGGRVLRAYLWRSGRDLTEATVLTGRSGQIIAVALGAMGLFFAVGRGQMFLGFWALLTGIFLFDSASDIITAVKNADRRRVDDIMRLPPHVAPDISLQQFIDTLLPMNRQAAFPVAVDRRIVGILTLADMMAVAKQDLRTTRVADVMRPIAANMVVETGTEFFVARELMRTNGVASVAVVSGDGSLVGFIV